MSKCKTQFIIPHRSYRRLRAAKIPLIIESVIYLFLSVAAVYVYLSYIFNTFSNYLHTSLAEANIPAGMQTVEIFGFGISLVDLPFMHTQPLSLFFILLGILILFYVLKKQSIIPYNIAMWLNFFILMFSVFILYFIFLGQYFPYDFVGYFELYHTAHIGLMLFSLMIMSLAFVLTPSSHIWNFTAFFGMLVYYFIYSLVRYAFTVLLLAKVSIVFAPIMFFTMYLDFIFFVSVYSYFLYKSAEKLRGEESEWKW
ncbi:MAG TPA: hypothetical protein EYH42_01110 [Sulfurovum sp.]|nr:hypothetical protein [Sulfurovum sp.]